MQNSLRKQKIEIKEKPFFNEFSFFALSDFNLSKNVSISEMLAFICSSPLEKNILFCCHAVVRALNSCREGRYTSFDAHTTANCCHGIAILNKELIGHALKHDLSKIQEDGEERIAKFEKDGNLKNLESWFVPKCVIELSFLFILNCIKEIDPIKGDRTKKSNLKNIFPVGTRFCDTVINNLQKHHSQLVAKSYDQYCQRANPDIHISGAPLSLWGKYVGEDYVRKDKCGFHYAPAMYSMQVAMSHLVTSGAIIAFVLDLKDAHGNLKDRYVQLLRGDGKSQYRYLENHEVEALNEEDPIIIFGGCVHSDAFDTNAVLFQLSPWLEKFSHLVLACDIFYPQFPAVKDDPSFDSKPIEPLEKELQMLIDEHAKVKGVSAKDPSLFCLTHIYSASTKQVMKVVKNEETHALPINRIPPSKTFSLTEE